MAWAGMNYREIRFVIGDELTDVYVRIEALGDCPMGVQGWHHKTFPPSLSVKDIFEKRMFGGGDGNDCVLWPLEAPPQ